MADEALRALCALATVFVPLGLAWLAVRAGARRAVLEVSDMSCTIGPPRPVSPGVRVADRCGPGTVKKETW